MMSWLGRVYHDLLTQGVGERQQPVVDWPDGLLGSCGGKVAVWIVDVLLLYTLCPLMTLFTT